MMLMPLPGYWIIKIQILKFHTPVPIPEYNNTNIRSILVSVHHWQQYQQACPQMNKHDLVWGLGLHRQFIPMKELNLMCGFKYKETKTTSKLPEHQISMMIRISELYSCYWYLLHVGIIDSSTLRKIEFAIFVNFI